MTFRLGLTGGIAMGKSTTASALVARGAALWDADGAVHRLYSGGGGPLAQAFPEAIRDGEVSRPALREIIARDPGALARIEAIVHPIVRADRAAFLRDCRAPLAVCDIPLLFETDSEGEFDGTATVSCPPEIQRARALARPGMTEAHLDRILSRQFTDAQRRARATWVIRTETPEEAASDIDTMLADIARAAG